MKIEDQVCSLELAKRLKELGVKQESFCWWVEPEYTNDKEPFVQAEFPAGHTARTHIASAFTVAELGEMLPITIHGDFDHLICDKAIQHWFVYYSCDREGSPRPKGGLYLQTESTEANARAKLIVYLLENKFLNPDVLS